MSQENYNLQDYFSTILQSSITASVDDGSFTLQTPPSSTRCRLVINADDSSKREEFYIYNVVGNTCYYRGIDRAAPKAHSTNDVVKMNVMAGYVNYIDDKLGTVFNHERISALVIKVFGGDVYIKTSIVAVVDQELTLTDESINYIYFDFADNVIKTTTVEANTTGNLLLYKVTTVGGTVSLLQKTPLQILPFDVNSKVAVDTDAIPDYLGNDGVTGILRVTDKIIYSDFGDYIQLNINEPNIDLNNCDNATSLFISPSSIDILTNKSIDADTNTISNIELDNFKIGVIDTDVNLAADSDLKLATQKAVKAYMDALIGANDAMVYKGVIDCSANPNYPAADAGHTYKISVAGKIGGASGVNVQEGDTIMCLTDSTAEGDQATVGSNWNILQVNIDGAVITEDTTSVADTIVVQASTAGNVYKKSDVLLGSLENGDGAKEDIACPVTVANTNFDVTTSQTYKTGTIYTVSIGGYALIASEIISFTGTTLTLNVPFAVTADDTVCVSYIY